MTVRTGAESGGTEMPSPSSQRSGSFSFFFRSCPLPPAGPQEPTARPAGSQHGDCSLLWSWLVPARLPAAAASLGRNLRAVQVPLTQHTAELAARRGENKSIHLPWEALYPPAPISYLVAGAELGDTPQTRPLGSPRRFW